MVSLVASASSKSLIKLNDENWHDVLQGEWMVEFQVGYFIEKNSRQITNSLILESSVSSLQEFG
jgi:hypothetical protein